MANNPVTEWQELSALYEEADTLDAPGCAALLERLRAKSHPLVGALEQMLAARDRVRTGSFLERLPRIAPGPAPAGDGGFAPGDHFGPYCLVRRIGSGGMAQVWLAERDDGAFHRHVAVKLPYRHADGPQREGLAQRFARERDILAALNHPNIAAMHDAGVTPDGQPWLAMEYVEGEPITAWCDRQRLTVRERVRLFRQVLRAVQHAHANLVIHRDLKPANILVTEQGNVRLLDFGIAKLVEPDVGRGDATALTREGGAPLTLLYASPEQITGAPLTTACDVYALGVVLYELLAGVRPYELKIESAAQVEQAIVEQEPRAPSRRVAAPAALTARRLEHKTWRGAVAPDLDAIVLKALSKAPPARYGTVQLLLAELDRWLQGEPVEAQQPSARYRIGKFVARNRLAVSLGAGAVASLLAITAVAVAMGVQARHESARAIAARDFLLNMFRQADPEQNGGRDITARALLDAGQANAMSELASQSRLQAEVLQGIGEVNGYLGDYVRAGQAIEQAVAIHRREGRQRETGLSMVSWAEIRLRAGDDDGADRLLQDAGKDYQPGAEDHEFLARLWRMRGWLSRARQDLPAARVAAETALGHAQKAYGDGARPTIEALRQLAETQGLMGRFDAAMTLLAEAERQIAQVPGVNLRDRISLQLEQATAEFSAGEFGRANLRLVRALAECELGLGSTNEECNSVRHRRALTMLVMGHDEGLLPLLPPLLQQAGEAGSPKRQSEALTMAARLIARNHRAERYPDVFDRVAALAESDAQVRLPEIQKLTGALVLAEARLQYGDALGALHWAREGRARAQRAGIADLRIQGRVHLLEGVALQMRAEHLAALAALDAAVEAYGRALSRDNPLVLLFGLNRARSLQALGRSDEARGVVADAEPTLRRVLGGEAPVLRQIERLRREIDGGLAATAPQGFL